MSNDEWDQGEEISLFDMSEGMNSVRLMNESALDDTVSVKQTKLIYVYDFLSMWTFFVELAEIVDETEGVDYPNLMFVHGQIPDSAPDKVFEAEKDDLDLDEYDDDFDVNDYDNLNFDEHWN